MKPALQRGTVSFGKILRHCYFSMQLSLDLCLIAVVSKNEAARARFQPLSHLTNFSRFVRFSSERRLYQVRTQIIKLG